MELTIIISSTATTIFSFIIIGILKHIVKKIDIAKNDSRLANHKIESLVDANSEIHGNGTFRELYDKNLARKIKEDNFVYRN